MISIEIHFLLIDLSQLMLQIIINLLNQAHDTTEPVLLPHVGFLTPPGGRLLHKLAGHVDTVADVDITAEGDIVATGESNKSKTEKSF